MFFFLKYTKDLRIIVIKKRSLTIQTTHSDERPRRSTKIFETHAMLVTNALLNSDMGFQSWGDSSSNLLYGFIMHSFLPLSIISQGSVIAYHTRWLCLLVLPKLILILWQSILPILFCLRWPTIRPCHLVNEICGFLQIKKSKNIWTVHKLFCKNHLGSQIQDAFLGLWICLGCYWCSKLLKYHYLD
jgi:hypothetical protein